MGRRKVETPRRVPLNARRITPRKGANRQVRIGNCWKSSMALQRRQEKLPTIFRHGSKEVTGHGTTPMREGGHDFFEPGRTFVVRAAVLRAVQICSHRLPKGPVGKTTF